MLLYDASPATLNGLGNGAIICLQSGSRVERFIKASPIRGIVYWVSLDYGISYTRPQLVDKYRNIGAELFIERTGDCLAV